MYKYNKASRFRKDFLYLCCMEGLVIKSTGSWYWVKDTDGNIHDCRIKGKFRIKGIKTTNPLAVGDRVEFSPEQDNQPSVITKILPRANYIIRKSVNLSKQAHIIAANIDQAILFVTLAFPATTTGFIDRFLVTAEAYQIPCTIVFNKVDLYDEEMLLDLEAYKMLYENLGYNCVVCSALNSTGLEPIKELLKGKVSLVSGHSGVGKSTLINSLDPDIDIATNEISDIHLQGKHTTTFAEMHDLCFGGSIIDTPGIRGFGLVYIDKQEIQGLFPEFRSYAENCKFNNCIHIQEPHCGVKKALDQDLIFTSRYENYISMMEDQDQESVYR